MGFLDDIFAEQQKAKKINLTMIFDLSGLLHATFNAQVKFDKTLKDNHEKFAMWRYLLLNQISSVKTKFKPDEIVLAIDSKSWRKTEFKYYKANRDLAKETSNFDYTEFFEVCNQFIDELEQNFPYKVIKVDTAEADDIIAVLAHSIQNNILIVSRDKDFKQLLKLSNVKIYDPIDKKYKEVEDPYQFLIEHILRGDGGDGVPNLLSDDNVFVNSEKRQKNITKKILAEVAEVGLEKFAIKHNYIANYERNRKLIDLSIDNIPESITIDTKFKYDTLTPKGDYIKVLQFLKKHNIKSLIDKASVFLF